MGNKKFLLFFSVLGIMFFAGCGPNEVKPLQSFIAPHSTHEESQLQVAESGISGNGQILFTQPLLSTTSKENYVLQFKALEDIDSEIVLTSHVTDYFSADGVEIHLKNRDGYWKVAVRKPKGVLSVWTELFPVTSNQVEQVSIEVHNDNPSGARVLIWNMLTSYDGKSREPYERIQLGNHIFDSDQDIPLQPGRGRSMLWSLELKGIQLYKAFRQKARLQ